MQFQLEPELGAKTGWNRNVLEARNFWSITNCSHGGRENVLEWRPWGHTNIICSVLLRKLPKNVKIMFLKTKKKLKNFMNLGAPAIVFWWLGLYLTPSGPNHYILSTIYSTGCFSNVLIDSDNIIVPIKSNNVLILGQFFYFQNLVGLVFIGEGVTFFLHMGSG